MAEKLSILIVGCGAMGSVYAARLAAGGHDVHMLDRSAEHMAAIARSGLTLTGPDSEDTVRVRSASTTLDVGPVDMVVLAVKAADVGGAARTVVGAIGPHTVVVTIQNGLGSADEIAGVVGADRLAVGIASGFGASRPAPGQVHHNAMKAVRLGAYAGLPRDRLDPVVDAWRAAGFATESVPDIVAMQWEKLICNVAYSAPCALTGLTVGEVMTHPECGPVSRSAAREAWETARALGIAINVNDPVTHVQEFGAAMPAAKPSALLDVESGRVSEIGFINGAIPVQAARVALDAPVNETLTRLVRTRELAWHNG